MKMKKGGPKKKTATGKGLYYAPKSVPASKMKKKKG